MQTRPKLLHYGLSWPISGAFANPNCALAGRDCSILTVCWERKRGKIVHLPFELLSFIRYLSPGIICAQKLSYFFIWKSSFPWWIFYLLTIEMPAMTSSECLKRAFIWHELNSPSWHTYITFKCAEWQLYLQLQTGGSTEKVLLC